MSVHCVHGGSWALIYSVYSKMAQLPQAHPESLDLVKAWNREHCRDTTWTSWTQSSVFGGCFKISFSFWKRVQISLSLGTSELPSVPASYSQHISKAAPALWLVEPSWYSDWNTNRVPLKWYQTPTKLRFFCSILLFRLTEARKHSAAHGSNRL